MNLKRKNAIITNKSIILYLSITLLFAIAIGFISQILVSFLDSQVLTFVLFFILGIIIFIPIINRLVQKSFDLAEPGIWFALFFFAHFGIRALWDLKFGSPILGLDPLDKNFGVVNAALVVSILAFLLFWFAYSRPIGRIVAKSIPELPRNLNVNLILPMAIFCVIVGWGVRLFLIISQTKSIELWVKSGTDIFMRQASGVYYLQNISSLATIAVFLLFIGGRAYKRRSYKWFSYILLMPELAFSFLTGKRSYLPFLLLSFLIAYYMTSERGHKTSIHFARWAFMILLFLVFLFPIISSVRFQGFSNLKSVINSYTTSPIFIFKKVGGRLHDLDSLALIIEKVPDEEPHTLGMEFWLLSVAWIPRGIWSEKPVISIGETFQQKMIPSNVYPEGTSVSISLPGQFYWDLGITGVFVGMAFVGFLWRLLYEYLVKPKGNLSNSLIVAFMFTSFFVPLEQTLIAIFTGHLFKLFIILLVIFGVSWSKKKILGGSI